MNVFVNNLIMFRSNFCLIFLPHLRMRSLQVLCEYNGKYVCYFVFFHSLWCYQSKTCFPLRLCKIVKCCKLSSTLPIYIHLYTHCGIAWRIQMYTRTYREPSLCRGLPQTYNRCILQRYNVILVTWLRTHLAVQLLRNID